MRAPDDPFTNAEQIALVLAEGQGCLSARVYSIHDLAAAMAKARPDPGTHAYRVVALFGTLSQHAIERGPGDRPKCVGCYDEFDRDHLPVGVGLVEAAVPQPSGGMLFGVCPRCFRTGSVDAHLALFCRRVSATFGADLEILPPVHHRAGHA